MMKSPTIFSFTPSLMNAADLESIFVQREAIAADLVERIRESVLTPTKHHSLIIGARGMGKTHLVSLVYHRVQAMADLQERILIAWLREEEWGITSFLKLLLRILRAIDSSDPAIQQRIEALYELSCAEAEQAAMSLLTEIIGQRTLLLITENLDDLFKGLGEQGQQQLRAFLQNSGCCTILATAPRLFNGVQSRTKPFYGFFRPVRLQELTAAEAVQLLIQIATLREQTELVSFLRTPMGKARVQAVEHLAGGNPRIYVIFAEFLSRESLEELVQPFMALLDALTPYYQSRMQYLSAQQREIVEFLCDRKFPATVKDIAQRCFITSQTTSSQLKELKEKGYVNVESIGRESFYALQEPLMRICLGMKKERDSTLKFMVDFLRAWYSKSELDMLRQQISDGFMQEYLELALQESTTNEKDPRIAVYLEQMQDCFDLGFFEEALQYTQKLTTIRGLTADWLRQADTLTKVGRWEDAITNCDNALAIESENPQALYLSSFCLKCVANKNKMISCLENAELNYTKWISTVERILEIDPAHFNNIEQLLDCSSIIELVLARLLLTQNSSQWQPRIIKLLSQFEPFHLQFVFSTDIQKGLVETYKLLISPFISDTTAALWHDTWHELTHHLPEYQLPLRLLTTALHYKQKPDDLRVWMELSIEERKILQQALGIDSVESRD
jgi:tetratricopeptide (TPR) repeat protein